MKRILSAAPVLCLLILLFSPTASAAKIDEITDVPNNWMRLPVSYVLEKGYMTGIGNRCFDPYGAVSRAQTAQILWNREGSPSAAGLENRFADVHADWWYYNSILWCSTRGLLGGTGAADFAPNAPITRQDICVIFYRYYKDYLKMPVQPVNEAETAKTFTDYSQAAGYAKEALCWGYQTGFINGTSYNRIEPSAPITRAELAQFLRNFDIHVLNLTPSGYPVNSATVPLTGKGATKIIAHRGGGGFATENTVQAFEKSGALSYYGLECDVRRTKDNYYVIFHDNDLKRMAASGRRRIEEYTLEELQVTALYETRLEERVGGKSPDFRIPTLQEYINICKKHQKIAVVELKSELSTDDARKIADIITTEGYLYNTIFISSKTDLLITLRGLLPNQPLQLCGYYNFKLNNNTLSTLKKYRFDLNVDYHAVTADLVQTCHQNNIKVGCWSVNDTETAQTLLSYGVDYITTDLLE